MPEVSSLEHFNAQLENIYKHAAPEVGGYVRGLIDSSSNLFPGCGIALVPCAEITALDTKETTQGIAIFILPSVESIAKPVEEYPNIALLTRYIVADKEGNKFVRALNDSVHGAPGSTMLS